jgi:hypothetical protein
MATAARPCSWQFPAPEEPQPPASYRQKFATKREQRPRAANILVRKMRLTVVKIAMTAPASFLGLTTDLQAQAAVSVPEVEITGAVPGVLRQEFPVGSYGQPEWTTERAFSNSRVYVRPAGTLEFNQLWTQEFAEGHVTHGFREEVEIGLPYRFQIRPPLELGR